MKRLPFCLTRFICGAVCIIVTALGIAERIQAALPPLYQLVILPPPPGNINSHAEDVNNIGIVTGRSWGFTQDANPLSVFWNAGATPSPLPGNSGAYALNDAGHAAGVIMGSGGFAHSYFYDGTTVLDIHNTPIIAAVGPASISLDINNADQVVGYIERASFGRAAFLWKNGAAILLGTLGGPESDAKGINNLGQVSGNAETPNLSDRAFIWRDDNTNGASDPGEMVQLVDMGLSSSANAINDFGLAAGWVLTPSFKRLPGTWSSPGTFNPLPNLPGKTESEPLDIGISGDVVGASEGTAVLWRDELAFDLNQFITQGSGVVLRRASGINDQGWIVGIGTQGNSERGYLLIPVPEPSTLIIALSLLWMSLRRQRLEFKTVATD